MSLYLIAILPPDEINIKVLEWKAFMLETFGCRVALKSPAHITLTPPFNMPDVEQTGLQNVLQAFASTAKQFTVQLKDFSAFRPGVIFVHVSENIYMSELKVKLEDKLANENFSIKKEERPFRPHITIANRDLKKHDFTTAWPHFKDLHYETQFITGSITLLRHNGKTWDRVFDALLPEN